MTSIRTRRVAAAWLAAVLVAVGVPVGAAMANQTWCVNPAFTVPHGYLGGSGNDTITGNNNDNNMDGAGGNDTLSSLDGADHVCGSPGTDSITLGSSGGATEFAEGGTDGDTILGLTGVDYASGQGGADDIEGGQGDDNLYGNDGGDDLKGDEDNDDLFDGDGSDELTGNGGDDTFYLCSDGVSDTVNSTPGETLVVGGSCF